MRCYLSGWQASRRERELAVIQSGHMKYRCFSYAMIQQIPGLPYFLSNLQGSYEACIENKVGIMMDSGVVSWRTYRNGLMKQGNQKALDKLCGESQFIELYVDYVKKNRKKWDFCMTIDLARNAGEIFKRQQTLEGMGIKPVPVFHGDDSIDFLRRYHDNGHTLMSIASATVLRSNHRQFKAYLDAVFNLAAKLNIRLHGLAMTAPWKMLDYPWWSVDSSSWSRVAGYGSIMRYDENRQRLSVLHVSRRESSGKGSDVKQNTTMMKRIQKEIEAEGYDFETLRDDFVLRHVYNAATMDKLAVAAARRHRTGWNYLI